MGAMKGLMRRTVALGLTAGSVGLAACGISRQQEAQIGQSYSQQINAQLPLVDDPTVVNYVNLLGQQIARQGKQEFNYTFYVVNSDVVNAFALPGGYVYINRGIIDHADNMSELAGVMAHEIGHVEQHHAAQQMQREQEANIGLNVAYILLGRQPGQLEQAAIQVGGSAIFAGYSRGMETEADKVAVHLLPKAGIDPNGLTTFFKELLNEQQREPSAVEQWFSTHPLTEERIATVRTEIQSLNLTPSALSRLQVTNQGFLNAKAAMARYPQPPPEYRANNQ